MNGNELIIVKQLPVIEERLKQIESEIKAKVDAALALECTEKNVKEIKNIRSELNKDFAELEKRRKIIKKEVLAPYEAFENVYKECVTEHFSEADSILGGRIKTTEDKLKQEKMTEVISYFDEYAKSKGVDFLQFSDANIKVLLTSSKKGLLEAAKSFVDKVARNLEMIAALDNANMIRYYYTARGKNEFLDASAAVLAGKNLSDAISTIRTEKNEEASEPMPEANTEPLSAPSIVDDTVYAFKFTVYGTKAQLAEVKNFIIKKGLKYE